MAAIIRIDDQPVDATFFGKVDRLTDFVTPQALDVQTLHKTVTESLPNLQDRIVACWRWVTSHVKYVRSVKAKIWVEGRSYVQDDFWQEPSMTIHTQVGNCANSAMLLASLVRNELGPDQAYCVFGNLHSMKPGGHAWVKVCIDGEDFILEATSPKVPALVPEGAATRYEPVHYFNDKVVLAVEGRTQLVPYAEFYSTWLEHYLNWTYIEEMRKRHT